MRKYSLENFKNIISLLFFTVFITQIWAQTPEIERLIKLAETTSGEKKVIALNDVCKNYYCVNPEKGIEFGKQALQLAGVLKLPALRCKIYNSLGLNYWASNDIKTARMYYSKAYIDALLYKDTIEMVKTYNRMGLVYETLGDFDSCLIMFNKELVHYTSIHNDKEVGKVLGNIGTIHLHRGELKSALKYLLEAKTCYEKTDNKKDLLYINLKIAVIYSDSKDFEEAIKWFQLGIKQAMEIHDYVRVGMGINGIGIIYKKQGKYNEALDQYNKALEMVKNSTNKVLIMSIYENIGNVYVKQNKFKLATIYNKKALDMAYELNMPNAIAEHQVNLGENLIHQKEYAKARVCYEKALPTFMANHSQSNIIITYSALINANNELKDYAQSVKYYQLYIQAKDSLEEKELNTALDSIKVKFHIEQVKQENASLTEQTEMHHKTILMQRIIMGGSFLLFALLISYTFVIIRNRKRINSANVLLGIKNDDISAKVEQLQTANHKLLELSVFKDSMSSFLVHDLKNSLNTIINIDTYHNSEHQTKLIKQLGMQMLNLVINILDVSKYEHKMMKISAQDNSISYIINSAYRNIEYLATQKNISFKSNMVSDYIVKVDAGIMERVLVNLFTNAVKYSAKDRSVEVYAEPLDKNFLKIIVKDNGDGIEAQYLPFVFDKYSQAKVKHLGYAGATGIGLTFCKMAVETHSGHIGVDSVVEQGTSFWFTLPLSKVQKDVALHDPAFNDNRNEKNKSQLTEQEINWLIPFINQLKQSSIYEVSDVKEIINTIDNHESSGILAWKSALLIALSNCNEIKYNELLNLA